MLSSNVYGDVPHGLTINSGLCMATRCSRISECSTSLARPPELVCTDFDQLYLIQVGEHHRRGQHQLQGHAAVASNSKIRFKPIPEHNTTNSSEPTQCKLLVAKRCLRAALQRVQVHNKLHSTPISGSPSGASCACTFCDRVSLAILFFDVSKLVSLLNLR